jgi:phosphomannomutase
MSLIKSIAGVRGTIGGQVGQGLTPIDVVKLTAAFGKQVIQGTSKQVVAIGRDARPSGAMISQLVSATLQALGIEVVDLGLVTTPTLALAVSELQARGGMMISASHNPAQWNALKLLNQAGEYIDAATASRVFALADEQHFDFVKASYLGNYHYRTDYIEEHIKRILALPIVDRAAIAKRKFRVAVDAVNSVGGIAVPKLLKALGVISMTTLYGEPIGLFPHDPEPLPEHLTELANTIKQGDYDIGLAVDPDVDRLAIIDEKGQAWGEDYTLVAAADYVLSQTPGNTVSNLSSSSALQVLTEQYGGKYTASGVGEMYVVATMKATQAVIGGEGNGGVIYPNLHYNRDALVGIALVLSHLAKTGKTASDLRANYPSFQMLKSKIELDPSINTAAILEKLKIQYSQYPIDTQEGIKVSLDKGWFHLRQSNTEPIIRIHAEASTQEEASRIIEQVIRDL